MGAAESLLTLAQAAERSGCSVKTLRRAMDSGHLVAVRLGLRRGRSHDLAAVPAEDPERPIQLHPGHAREPEVQVRSVVAVKPSVVGREHGRHRTSAALRG